MEGKGKATPSQKHHCPVGPYPYNGVQDHKSDRNLEKHRGSEFGNMIVTL
jgi:hypothetical protein